MRRGSFEEWVRRDGIEEVARRDRRQGRIFAVVMGVVLVLIVVIALLAVYGYADAKRTCQARGGIYYRGACVGTFK